jgi:PAS domain S-box-containing protein
MTTAILYLSGNVGSDLYLIYFLIILIAATAPTLREKILFSILLCAVYGVILFLWAEQKGVVLEEHLLRIPILLILGAFYGFTTDRLRKEREQTADLIGSLTALKRAEEALRLSEAKFRDLVETTSDILWEVNAKGIYTYCSPNVAVILGYEPAELVGKTPFELMPPEEAQRVKDLWGKIAAERRPFSLLAQTVRHKNGRLCVMECSGKPVLDERGGLIGYRGVDRDITRRNRAEEALERLSRQHQLLLNSAGEGIYGLDLQGNTTFINPAAARMVGWEIGDLIGQPVHSILHHSPQQEGSVLPMNECPICAALEDGTVHRAESEVFWRKDGTRFPVEYVSTPIREESGELVGIVVTFRDITARKDLEEQLRQSQKMEAIGRLAGGVAHDFNNLLTAISGYCELLLMGLGNGDPLRRICDEITKAADRAAELTRHLLAFSRKQVLQPKVLDLNAVVSAIDPMLRRLIGEDLELTIIPAPALGRVKADRVQIEQVLVNLAVNARDAMPRGGKLIIETADVELDDAYVRRLVDARAGSYVMLAVSDTGSGMDAETLAHIFEPFFTTKEPGKGTGLGLSTVYGIVKQSGGYIFVYSEPDRGTTFKIYLPRVQEEVSLPDQNDVPAMPTTGWETVLLVEDEQPVRALVREILQRNGYAVLEAGHGMEALQISDRYLDPIHLMVTDVVMPGMSGCELAERLASRRPDTKVLYLSGYTDNALLNHDMMDPTIAFLQKPFTTYALARKVREVLDTPKAMAAGSAPGL